MKLSNLIRGLKLLVGWKEWSDLPEYARRNLLDVGRYLAQRWDVPLDSDRLREDVEWAVQMALKHGSPVTRT